LSQSSGDQPPRKIYRDRNLLLIFSVTLMAVMGVASLAPAFPKIISAFNLETHQIGLLITVFTLPGVVLAPLIGVLADRNGRKRLIVPALLLFGIAGTACALSTDYTILLIFRFFQGVGAAGIGSLNVTLIGDLYQGRERGAAMGYNASVLSLGTATYPALGGVLAAAAWNYPFFLTLLAIPVGLAVLFMLDNPEPINQQKLSDYLRAVGRSINKQVIGLYMASIVTFIILYGSYLTYYPILIGDRFSGSTVVIGLIMSLASLTTAATAASLGWLVKHFRSEALVRSSFLLYMFSMILIPLMPKLAFLIVPAMIFGIAQGINIPSIQTLLSGLAPIEHRAAFMSLNGMVLRIGQSLGPLVIGLAYTAAGLDAAFYGGALLALFTAVILTRVLLPSR
jgi:ACDE family multidrug resistance protein